MTRDVEYLFFFAASHHFLLLKFFFQIKFTYLFGVRKLFFYSTSVYVGVCSSRAEIKQSPGMRCVAGALAQVTGAVTR